ncbi:hypothetical protein [Sphaerisporangium sp. TRM90804]|uniref:hypothetical protein n=1 Tax=Sphaerisporangium sp. TRM90804 TaxID=3031113 RepID=UPI002446DC3C|nr:hypothetical protein [Sphaerisporangium sp. TRM90804]MDH2426207.1 hypothetical protein [Sphaerisporangium sp. TRM90804]
MNPTRKLWISAGVVGAILAGGISVAAAAASGQGSDKAGQESESSQTYGPGEAPGRIPGPAIPENAEPTRAPEEFVVREDTSANPKRVVEYWSEKRLEESKPLPVPVLTPEQKPKN